MIFTYGDINPLFHMNFLNDTVLNKYQFNPEMYIIFYNRHNLSIGPIKRWNSPRTEYSECPQNPLAIDRDKQTR